MRLRLEHSKLAYCVDFALYGSAIAVLALMLLIAAPRERLVALSAYAVAGLFLWTLIEYGMHRLLFHNVKPFSAWHAEHHDRPTALIYTPTIVSAGFIAALVSVPLGFVFDWWVACATTMGFLVGYLAYAVTHHATHHWPPTTAWARKRKRWHALHHSSRTSPGYYGVTTGIWDRVFGTYPRPAVGERERAPGVR